ncbi:Putative uncharacterized protein [Moritella viscosa]|uniref:hypothetical protein n=1 Tax=Moritella viscosa TaxID=80854 RepID=UPI0009186262|nr:hypothetical protein [Moritella viscosa]SHO23792.1 Putative uncharacterized protein [Moritella viscosa]
MDYAQDPMTGFKTLEHAFSQGFRMKRVPFTKDMYFVRDRALGYFRYTYARLDKLKVLQTVVLNGKEELNGLPCFGLYYGTLEELRGTGVTLPYIEKVLAEFTKNLPKSRSEFYFETSVDISNEASLSIATKLFGEATVDSIDDATGEAIRVWQTKVTR